MKRHFLLLLLFAGIRTLSMAQQKEEVTIKPKHWAATFSMGTVPLPQNPFSLQPGIEYFFTPQFSLFNEISIQTGKRHDLDSSAINKRYFKYKAEARYYLHAGRKGVSSFFGLQFTTARRKFDAGKAGRYYDTFQDDSVYSYTKASINSPIQTITVQFGGSREIADNFFFEIALGYGVRFVNTTYSSVENLEKIDNVGWFNIKPFSTYRYIGKVTRSQINLGFRFSYRF